MSFLIKKPGILTTVQDLGRNGFRRFGINQNGAMDKSAVRLLNALLATDENAPVLEMHFPAAEILFEKPAFFAIGGADFAARIDGAPLENWRIYRAVENSVLKFTQPNSGNRAYLAVRGGLKVERWVSSASTNLRAQTGGFQGRKLATGDRIYFDRDFERADYLNTKLQNIKIAHSLIPFYSRFPTVRVVAGAEFPRLTEQSRKEFLEKNYAVTPNSDRMGFRLRGEALHLREKKELVSSAVNFGTIQLLPDGQLIVLMADHQTTGGYPRIANVIPTDLPLLAQLGANAKVGFHLVSIEEAENLAVRFETYLKLLRAACKFKF